MLYLLNNIAAILAILIYHIYIYKKTKKKTYSPTLAHFVKAWPPCPMNNIDDANLDSQATHAQVEAFARQASKLYYLRTSWNVSRQPSGRWAWLWLAVCLLMGMPYMGIIILTYSYCVHIYRYIVIIVIIVVWMCGNPSAMAIIQTPPWNTPILRSISSPSPPKKLCFWVVFSINGGMGGMGLVSFEQLQPRWTHEEPEIVSHFHVLV